MTFIWKWIRPLPGRTISALLWRGQENLRLRTKLLFSFVFLTAGLTSATLLVVRWKAQTQVQHQIEQDARNATLTFQVVQQQQQTALSRKADLLAWLAYMRNGDATTIKDASENPWRSDDCNLFVLADKSGKIVALHSTGPSFPIPLAQEMVSRSLDRGETSGWWFSDKNLYQVALQPFYDGGPRKKILLGIVVVGRLIDEKVAADLGRLASSEVVFRHGGMVVASTLSALKEMELHRQFHDRFKFTQ